MPDIEIACGQDGSYLCLATLSGDNLVVVQYPFNDRTFYGNLSPDGNEFASGAHQGDALKIHAFPSGRVIAALEGERLFAEDDLPSEYPDSIGYAAIYLDCDHLLVETSYGRMLLIDRRTMQVSGTVWLTGYKLHGYDDSGKETDESGGIIDFESGLSSLHPAGLGRVLAVYNMRTIHLLDVSPLLGAPRSG